MAPSRKQQTVDACETSARELYNRGVRLAEEGDVAEARALFELAATPTTSNDDIEARRAARCYLGVLTLEDGDEDEAVLHFKSAADDGDNMAAVNLAVCVQRGVGVQQDEHAAFHEFVALAARGDAAALLNAGKCFLIGRGTAKDEAKAVRAFERAARMGEPYATYNLALAAELGIAMKQDLARARDLYESAAQNGVEGADDDATRVGRELNGIFDDDDDMNRVR